MKRCRYCHKRLYPWQSYSWDKMEQTHDYAVLIKPDYSDDAYIHDYCFFREPYYKQILKTLQRAQAGLE